MKTRRTRPPDHSRLCQLCPRRMTCLTPDLRSDQRSVAVSVRPTPFLPASLVLWPVYSGPQTFFRGTSWSGQSSVGCVFLRISSGQERGRLARPLLSTLSPPLHQLSKTTGQQHFQRTSSGNWMISCSARTVSAGGTPAFQCGVMLVARRTGLGVTIAAA